MLSSVPSWAPQASLTSHTARIPHTALSGGFLLTPGCSGPLAPLPSPPIILVPSLRNPITCLPGSYLHTFKCCLANDRTGRVILLEVGAFPLTLMSPADQLMSPAYRVREHCPLLPPSSPLSPEPETASSGLPFHCWALCPRQAALCQPWHVWPSSQPCGS